MVVSRWIVAFFAQWRLLDVHTSWKQRLRVYTEVNSPSSKQYSVTPKHTLKHLVITTSYTSGWWNKGSDFNLYLFVHLDITISGCYMTNIHSNLTTFVYRTVSWWFRVIHQNKSAWFILRSDEKPLRKTVHLTLNIVHIWKLTHSCTLYCLYGFM